MVVRIVEQKWVGIVYGYDPLTSEIIGLTAVKVSVHGEFSLTGGSVQYSLMSLGPLNSYGCKATS